MNKMKKSILSLFAVVVTLFVTTAFIISDPKADYTNQRIRLEDQVLLSEIATKNKAIGVFKTALKFKQKKYEGKTKEFYGQQITIAENPQVDKILIGVTNNLISRIEIWNQNKLIKTKELGFMGKMTLGATHTMTVEFYDQTNEKYKGKSKISMRFYNGTGFLGDIGTINFELSDYGNFSGEKTIGVFAKGIDSKMINRPDFLDFKIWKNYRSFD